ncbi:MAG: multidrug efflux SMR transporter [Sphingobacteriales bacterium]|jgi:quaternary ammonium compound-resistance protein SugE|nr:multidrug efflux SMR transporter [Sphingobacteriales bacterium]MBP9140118.1 multidrug efflux SMR transporter [Chitinophagales bacterium]MDA0198232.1 multidrug efflux SMR transporter [Bacteroidota bacterium]MBK6889979.1 multidrug efflux SMR transporter [Sphingobacteriales bacterium]MBK7527498.1 multidrug efflux SMR transporter [Sphingobacteriales bacterium]
MPWIYLLLAGLFEIGFTSFFKLSNNFTHHKYTVAFVVSAALSLWFLNKAVQHIALGTAYAVWTGIGAAGTVIIGLLYFNEPANFWRLFFISLLIAAVIGLKLISK